MRWEGRTKQRTEGKKKQHRTDSSRVRPFLCAIKLWQKFWGWERLRFQFWWSKATVGDETTACLQSEGPIFYFCQRLDSMYVCVCVFASCERGVCVGGVVEMLKFHVDNLHAPSGWLLGRVKRHGRLLQPTWPQSPLYTMSLCYLPTLWSPSTPSHIQTQTHPHT